MIDNVALRVCCCYGKIICKLPEEFQKSSKELLSKEIIRRNCLLSNSDNFYFLAIQTLKIRYTL